MQASNKARHGGNELNTSCPGSCPVLDEGITLTGLDAGNVPICMHSNRADYGGILINLVLQAEGSKQGYNYVGIITNSSCPLVAKNVHLDRAGTLKRGFGYVHKTKMYRLPFLLVPGLVHLARAGTLKRGLTYVHETDKDVLTTVPSASKTCTSCASRKPETVSRTCMAKTTTF